MRDVNIAINGPILKAKAEEFAENMKIESFSCSEGWLDRFKDMESFFTLSVANPDPYQMLMSMNGERICLIYVKAMICWLVVGSKADCLTRDLGLWVECPP